MQHNDVFIYLEGEISWFYNNVYFVFWNLIFGKKKSNIGVSE